MSLTEDLSCLICFTTEVHESGKVITCACGMTIAITFSASLLVKVETLFDNALAILASSRRLITDLASNSDALPQKSGLINLNIFVIRVV